MTDVINLVLPIVALLVVGMVMRRTAFVDPQVVEGVRKIVVNLALPAVLFTAFLAIEFEVGDAGIIAFTFGLCLALYWIGVALRRRVRHSGEYFPFLVTGFESGMLGIGLFGAVFGLERIQDYAIVDLGHEVFIWFVFLPLLLIKRDGTGSMGESLRLFVTSPVIIAIVAGIILGLFGLEDTLREMAFLGGLMNTLDYVAALTIPLILLVIGFGIELGRSGVVQAAPTVLFRLAIVLPLALVLPPLVIGQWLDGDVVSQAALFTLLVLPPPFIVPLYMPLEAVRQRTYVNNVLSLYTLVSIALFITYIAVTNP